MCAPRACRGVPSCARCRLPLLASYSWLRAPQAWEVARIHSPCVRRGDVPPPSVYQGMYNGLTRDVERELFPCLRALNMAFFAVASMRLRI
jgi:aryl-alcohol dehydrogenase-like predicted oxidoreductase